MICTTSVECTIEIRFEVKCSRKGKFHIKDRELKGLKADFKKNFGYLTVLISSDNSGPRWILVPENKVVPRTYSEKILIELETKFKFWERINGLWGDVLLDSDFIDKLLNMPKINFKSMDWWNQLPFSPQKNIRDAIWRIKVKDALHNLRHRLDIEYKRYGARREGFIHQCILCYCLKKSGYETISNITGVPDLRTQVSIFDHI